jgi:hypothetical protein
VSRVDDDRQDDLAAQRAALQRRLDEMNKADRNKAQSNFAQLVTTQQGQRQQQQTEKSAVQALLEEAQAASEQQDDTSLAQGRGADARNRAGLATGTLKDKRDQTAGAKADRSAADRSTQRRGGEVRAQQASGQGHVHDEEVGAAGASSKGEDRREAEQGLKDRAEAAKKAQGQASGQKGTSKAEDSASRGGKGNQGGGDQKPPDVPQGFRFNPALMAPVPVAKPRDMAGAERLRAIANEIAQKIVERVRVGQNAAGKAEFQIDLRSNVLKGLSIKVSGANGKISAVFSGADKDTRKMLEEQAETLRSALSGRGLQLADFKVEEHA